MKNISIDGKNQLLLNTLEKYYIVAKGRVFLHIAEIDDQGNNKRKFYVGTFNKGEGFIGECVNYNHKKFGLFASGELGTLVIEKKATENEAKVELFYNKLNIDCKKDNEFTSYNQLLFDVLHEKRKATLEYEHVGFKIREKNIKKAEEKKYSRIFNAVNQKTKTNDVFANITNKDILYDTMKIIADNMKITLAPYEVVKKCTNEKINAEDIARVSKIPIRYVVLDQMWYKEDCGPLLVNTIDDERPLALLPVSPSKYMVYDVLNGTSYPLNKEISENIIPRGQIVYRPFPAKKLNKKDIFVFGMKSAWKRDIVKIFVLAFVGTLIGLLIPILNEKIFDSYIPEGATSELIGIGILILCFMLGNFFITLMKMFAVFRASNKMEYSLQSAVFDRILNLPSAIFSKYDSGNFASRAMGITAIFNILADVVVSAILSSVFSLMYLWRMFSYSKQLSWAGIIMVAISVVISLIIGYVQLKYEKQLINISNKMSGVMYQLLLGISKLRLSSAEDRAVNKYEKDFLEARKIVITKEKMTRIVAAFSTIVNVVFSIVIYYLMIEKNISISFGVFAAFMSAFGSFSGAMMGLSQTYIKVNRLIPIYDKAKPILETLPEYDASKQVPGDVTGNIELQNVTFRYNKEDADVINNISLSIKKGEYLGIVGTSGCGKSTLMKIMLGFEIPRIGKVFYDDMDLDGIDKRELRKKIGVVLQDGQIISGSIQENISINSSRIPLKRIREVLKEVGLEADLEGMPMGIHTALTEDGSTISGGQKQRILIARAIASKPNILLFDEATSALDNITQKIVCDSLNKLDVTRIVIAHRLSTIIDCDRIIVMDNGKIIEEGNYQQLMDEKGNFYELAIRQIV